MEMSMVNFNIFKLAAAVVSIYAFLCFIRIILTWIPTLAYSPVTRFLASICDPYLNLFRGIRFLRIGGIDLSPLLALGVLEAVQMVLGGLGSGRMASISSLLALLIQVAGQIFFAVLQFIIVVLIIRLIIVFLQRQNSYSPILSQLDSSLSPIVYGIAKTFTGGKEPSYKAALIISIIALIVVSVVFNLVLGTIIRLIALLPF